MKALDDKLIDKYFELGNDIVHGPLVTSVIAFSLKSKEMMSMVRGVKPVEAQANWFPSMDAKELFFKLIYQAVAFNGSWRGPEVIALI